MVNSLILPPETIAKFQKSIEILEKCLNDANPQDELVAEIIELENSGMITLSQLLDKLTELKYKLDKFNKLVDKLEKKSQPDQLSILLFVRYSFLLQEILEKCSELNFIKHENTRQVFIKYIRVVLNTYLIIINEASSLTYPHDEEYILVETGKYVIQSIIKACLQFNLLTEEFTKLLEQKDDIIPKESEAMLISLASTKKWDWVYSNLA
ncbi:hypothetical protein [Nostoc sp. PCC 7107]|uniref:hypothetical protein n=1 Tax=Nostoc sp. PCC 7107 TaxID=317936 RepID=UPI00029F15BE|nr:hypothetical protein [Nostoc sp. PCC 7107]AFY44399.1 hypothetical protein Nos7107_3839 [Nostoc sp. PCC 7107]